MKPTTRRRNTELALGLLAVLITGFGYLLVQLADKPDLPPDLWAFLGIVFGLYVVAHLAVRRFAPNADPTLLPIAALLNGIGFITISRLDRDLARVQAGWTAAGVGVFVATLVIVKRIRTLERYRYTFLLLGILALVLPLVPGIGKTINGARLWVGIGPLNFQPGEAAKVLLVVFFAAYLVDKRELLRSGSRRVMGLAVPALKHLGPLLLAWAVSILIMVRQKDLGSSLLFFAVFAAMLYIATERAAYLLFGLVMFVGGATIAYQLFGHVQDRVVTWIDPFQYAQRQGIPDRAVAVRVRHRRLRRDRSRARQPTADPERGHRLRVLRDRRGARPARDHRGAHRVPAAHRLRLPDRGAGGPSVPQAVRGRAHDDHRRADVRDHRRRHPRDPTHRHHVAVHLLRRLVARRQLRDHRPADAHLRRQRHSRARGPS